MTAPLRDQRAPRAHTWGAQHSFDRRKHVMHDAKHASACSALFMISALARKARCNIATSTATTCQRFPSTLRMGRISSLAPSQLCMLCLALSPIIFSASPDAIFEREQSPFRSVGGCCARFVHHSLLLFSFSAQKKERTLGREADEISRQRISQNVVLLKTKKIGKTVLERACAVFPQT